ncbi:hypothetical protein GOODEAATRI_021110 [Goodea atripinnis]|uniref:Uncharacterized protein n=1 Tax=Goodea atripinnis TaxID=208336 RepID=A0ABV0P6M8_9TELE
MILPYGSTGLIFIVHGQPLFAVKCLGSWYSEHLRSFQLESTRHTTVLQLQDLTDSYPLAAYTDNSIESQREAVIRGLILYLGEKIEDLIKDYQIYGDDDAAAVQDALRHWSSVSLWSEKLGVKGRGKLG